MGTVRSGRIQERAQGSTVGAGDPSRPLSQARRSLGRRLMGANLSQVLSAFSFCSLLLWVSSPSRRQAAIA